MTTNGNSLFVLYGSNAGTCKYLAEDLETAAKDRGYQATMKIMDEATEHLPTNIPVAIITPSYEGRPADNAKKFVAWLESSAGKSLENVKYAIFGVGNSEWSSTFHRIPKLLDGLLPELGAEKIVDSNLVDVRDDLMGPWEDWRDELLTSSGGEAHSVHFDTTVLAVTVNKPQVAIKLAGDEIAEAFVKFNQQVADTQVGPAKRHTEIELPQGTTYDPGGLLSSSNLTNRRLIHALDYLVVLPTNPRSVIRRAANRFKLNLDDVITISGTSKEFLASLPLLLHPHG
jgi:cytochrome P450/NADPH-cytochrome P450 reductase